MYKIKNYDKDESYALRWFSKYIRLRDAINTTHSKDYAVCITCDNVFPILEMDAGHMIPGRTNGILFDEEIVHAQCRSCNRFNGGEKQAYRIKMEQKHGKKWYLEKVRNRKIPCKLNYREMGDIFKEKYKILTQIENYDTN